MADDVDSDGDQYENESFENDSECEVPEVIDESSDIECENKNKTYHNKTCSDDKGNNSNEDHDPDLEPENNIYAYTRKQLSRGHNAIRKQDYVPYTSSSDEDTDVVISKTIAEINTQPMVMDMATTPKTPHTKSAIALIEVQKGVLEEPKSILRKQNNNKLTSETESESRSEADSDSVSEQEVKIAEKIIKTEKENNIETSEEVCLSLRTNLSHYISEQDSSSREQIDNETDDNNVENDNDEDEDENEEVISDDEVEIAIPQHEHLPLSPKYYPGLQLLRSNKSVRRDVVSSYYADDNEAIQNTSRGTKIEGQVLSEPRIDYCISSRTPSNFNSDDYAFHMNFMHKSSSGNVKLRSGQRKSWSFSNERVREIDRQNQILLKKILTQKPTYSLNPKNQKPNIQNRSLTSFSSATRLTTAALNRKKQQRQIDLDNLVLKRKIEAISSRRPTSKN